MHFCSSTPLSIILVLSFGLQACDKRREREPTVAESASLTKPSAAEREQVAAQASAAINPFKKRLSEALTSAMAQGGPVAAIDVCSEQAPRLAAEASTPDLTVGRSALKLRNPNNAARPWLTPILTELAALPSAEGAQRFVKLDSQRFGYAEAITLKPQCLACHGTEVAAPIAEKIKERYPDDQATGFQPGQLRGVFWAEVALAQQL